MSEVGKYPRQQRQKDYMDGHQRKQRKFICCVIRRDEQEHVILTGKIQGKKARGR